MKISDLLEGDKESIILAINLLGTDFINYLIKNRKFGTFSLMAVCLKEPDRLHIDKQQLFIPDSWEHTDIEYLKQLVSEYENFSSNN